MAAGFESPQKANYLGDNGSKNGEVSHRADKSAQDIKNMGLRNNQSANLIPSTTNSALKKSAATNIEVHDKSGQQSQRTVVKNVAHLRNIQS